MEVVTSVPPTGSSPHNASYHVHRWPVLRDAGGNVRGYLQYLSFDLPLFFRLLFMRRADIVVVEPPPTTGFVVWAVSRIRRIPFVYFSADVSSTAAKGIGLGGKALKLLTMLEGFVLRSARGILAVSEGVRDEVAVLCKEPGKVFVVGTGVDTEVFSSDGPAVTTEGPYFVYAGTMSEIQGASVFVDGFASLAADYPNVRLFMFGQGVELEELKRRAASVADQVHFIPPAPGEEVARWMRGALANLASVRPGKGYDFAFATKSLAGLASGSPTIYAGVGPMRQLVEENNLGWSCDWKPAAVADAMRLAIGEPPTPERRTELAAWVEANHSLHRVGAVAAQRVMELL